MAKMSGLEIWKTDESKTKRRVVIPCGYDIPHMHLDLNKNELVIEGHISQFKNLLEIIDKTMS